MRFLRFASRSLLASYFVADGLRALSNPEPLVEQASSLSTKAQDYSHKYLPPQVNRFVPTTTTNFVRLHGLIQILGALLMATGILRRPGAMLLAVTYAPKVSAAANKESPGIGLFRELALLGGVLIEAGDSQGKPRRSWLKTYSKQAAALAQLEAKRARDEVREYTKQQSKFAHRRALGLAEILSPESG